MLFRVSIVICLICIASLSFAAKIVEGDTPHLLDTIHQTSPKIKMVNDTYKTEDILLLFKSCYETIYFLGNTKYKRTKKELKEEDVSKQCFCICDKVRAKYRPKEFLDKPPIEIHNIIKPLTSECIDERGQLWYDEEK